MEERYQQAQPMTDEFMTPLVINEEGLIRGTAIRALARLVCHLERAPTCDTTQLLTTLESHWPGDSDPTFVPHR